MLAASYSSSRDRPAENASLTMTSHVTLRLCALLSGPTHRRLAKATMTLNKEAGHLLRRRRTRKRLSFGASKTRTVARNIDIGGDWHFLLKRRELFVRGQATRTLLAGASDNALFIYDSQVACVFSGNSGLTDIKFNFASPLFCYH